MSSRRFSLDDACYTGRRTDRLTSCCSHCQSGMKWLSDACSGGSSPQHLGAGTHGERGSASLKWKSGGRAPSRVQGQNIWSARGQSPPLKLEHFWFLGVQWKPQICPIFYNLETQRHQIFVLFCKKITGGHETGGGWSKTEGCALPRPGPKTATGRLAVHCICA